MQIAVLSHPLGRVPVNAAELDINFRVQLLALAARAEVPVLSSTESSAPEMLGLPLVLEEYGLAQKVTASGDQTRPHLYFQEYLTAREDLLDPGLSLHGESGTGN